MPYVVVRDNYALAARLVEQGGHKPNRWSAERSDTRMFMWWMKPAHRGGRDGRKLEAETRLNVGIWTSTSQAKTNRRPSRRVEEIGRVERPENENGRSSAQGEVVYGIHAQGHLSEPKWHLKLQRLQAQEHADDW
jgi:hypothetical protein